MVEQPTSTGVGAMYGQFTDLFAQAPGGTIHLGCWDGSAPEATVEGATDRLTDLVAERLSLPPDGQAPDLGYGTGRPAVRSAADLLEFGCTLPSAVRPATADGR